MPDHRHHITRMWAIYSKDNRIITIKLRTERGLEDMELYANPQAAYNALAMMYEEDRIRYGAHVREVVQP